MKHIMINSAVAMLMLLAAGCSQQESLTEDTTVSTPLSINVKQGSFTAADNSAKTRTTESGVTTTFTQNDKIGIYIVDKTTGTAVESNLCYNFNGTNWVNTTTKLPILEYNPNYVYYAYYPYKESPEASSPGTGDDVIPETFFANLISGWEVSTDQGTLANYTKNDLMVSKATIDAATGFTFDMAHQMALIEFDFPQVKLYYPDYTTQEKYVFTSNQLYNMANDGKYRMIVKPGTNYTIDGDIYNPYATTPIVKSTFEISTGTSLVKNSYTYYLNAAKEAASYTDNAPKLGDIYYSTGLWSGTYDTNYGTPIGIIVSTDASYCEPDYNYGHGLVLALNNAGNVAWADAENDISTLNNITIGAQYRADKSGISNCKKIQAITGYSSTTFPACYAATTTYNITVKAPSTSSGWFLPSTGQWNETLRCSQIYYNAHNTPQYSINFTTWETMEGNGAYAEAGAAIMNYMLSNKSASISYTNMRTSNYYVYWCSSEYSNLYACDMAFFTDGVLYLAYTPKSKGWTARPFLAF